MNNDRPVTLIVCLLLLAITTNVQGQMHFPTATWESVAPAEQRIDATKLQSAIDYLQTNSGRNGVHQLLIVRNGQVVWSGDESEFVHGVWSCTKVFTSTTLGLLIDDEKTTLDSLAKDYVPDLTSSFSEITLRHFTTMTSGYRARGDAPRNGYTHGPSSTPFLPGDSPLFAPGVKYAYWDSAMNEFAAVLTRIAGQPLDDLFRSRIADPIQMDPKQWRWGDFGSVDGIKVNGGAGNQGRHVFISARQLARLGQLFLNGGRWNGKQLISETWVDQATAVQVPADIPWGHRASGIDGRGVYGFNWWRNGIKSNGRRIWPGATKETYAASGYNNNKMFVVPAWNVVIVRLGLDQADAEVSDDTWGEFLRLVGGAIAN